MKSFLTTLKLRALCITNLFSPQILTKRSIIYGALNIRRSKRHGDGVKINDFNIKLPQIVSYY